MKTLNVKSNEGVLYAFLGWSPCYDLIHRYEDCKNTGTPLAKEPTKCYNEAKTLQQCYTEKAMKIQPLCLPVFNDAKECLFKSDTYIYACKEEINELVYCNENPKEYADFLASSTPEQRKSRTYDFFKYNAKFDKYVG